MALETKCLTPGAQFHTNVGTEYITVSVDVPPGTLKDLTKEEAELLEKLLHNQIELVLRPYFMRAKHTSVWYNKSIPTKEIK